MATSAARKKCADIVARDSLLAMLALRLVEAVLFHLGGQVVIGHFGPFQLSLDMPGRPFGPFPFRFRVSHAPSAVSVSEYVLAYSTT